MTKKTNRANVNIFTLNSWVERKWRKPSLWIWINTAKSWSRRLDRLQASNVRWFAVRMRLNAQRRITVLLFVCSFKHGRKQFKAYAKMIWEPAHGILKLMNGSENAWQMACVQNIATNFIDDRMPWKCTCALCECVPNLNILFNINWLSTCASMCSFHLLGVRHTEQSMRFPF